MPTIMHVDLDAFFCAVEQRRRPTLAGRPFVVAGRSHERGVVATASYAARAYGIRAGTPTAKALRACPDLIIVPPDYAAYMEAAEAVMTLLRRVAPHVEQASIDEAYVDISACDADALMVARQVQHAVANELKLSISCGIASNKLVAKAATDRAKTLARSGQMPHAIYVVPAGQESAFLAPLPVETLCGIGPKTTRRLHELGIGTLGELGWQRCSDVQAHFSARQAAELIRWARGIDERPLQQVRPAKSLSHETTFLRDVTDRAVVVGTVLTLAQALAHRLRHKRLRCWVVHCRIRWDMHHAVAKQTRLTRATHQATEIFVAACRLLDDLWDGRQSMRLVGVGVAQLGVYPEQLGFWDAELADQGEQWAASATTAIAAAEAFQGHPLSTQRIEHRAARRWSPHHHTDPPPAD